MRWLCYECWRWNRERFLSSAACPGNFVSWFRFSMKFYIRWRSFDHPDMVSRKIKKKSSSTPIWWWLSMKERERRVSYEACAGNFVSWFRSCIKFYIRCRSFYHPGKRRIENDQEKELIDGCMLKSIIDVISVRKMSYLWLCFIIIFYGCVYLMVTKEKRDDILWIDDRILCAFSD